MAVVKSNLVAGLLKNARAKTEEVKKEGFHTQFTRPRDLKAGETIEYKFLLPVEGQAYPAEVLYIETGKDNTFRSHISQNFPFSPNGACVLADAIQEVSNDPDGKAKHETILKTVKRVKKLIYPVLAVRINTDASGGVMSYEILDDEVKFLELTPNQSLEVLNHIDSRGAKNDDGGCLSWSKGKLISCTRIGTDKNNTRYTFALSEVLEFNEKDEKKFNVEVDVEDYIKTQIPSEDKLNEHIVKLFS